MNGNRGVLETTAIDTQIRYRDERQDRLAFRGQSADIATLYGATRPCCEVVFSRSRSCLTAAIYPAGIAWQVLAGVACDPSRHDASYPDRFLRPRSGAGDGNTLQDRFRLARH